jgi:hypothetical protein
MHNPGEGWGEGSGGPAIGEPGSTALLACKVTYSCSRATPATNAAFFNYPVHNFRLYLPRSRASQATHPANRAANVVNAKKSNKLKR